MKATIRQILDAPDLDCHVDCYSIMSAMVLLANQVFNIYIYHGDPNLKTNVTLHVKIDVQYDHRRGAETSVLKSDGVPFAVISRAGRELDDVHTVCVLDEGLALNAVRQFEDYECDPEAIVAVDDEIDLLFWEGIPVNLGDQGYNFKGDES